MAIQTLRTVQRLNTNKHNTRNLYNLYIEDNSMLFSEISSHIVSTCAKNRLEPVNRERKIRQEKDSSWSRDLSKGGKPFFFFDHVINCRAIEKRVRGLGRDRYVLEVSISYSTSIQINKSFQPATCKFDSLPCDWLVLPLLLPTPAI